MKIFFRFQQLGFITIFIFTVLSCNQEHKPVEFSVGEHQCAYCMMGIVDMRFRSEAITKKGRVYYFDSIECLASWSHDHDKTIGSAWVGNFAQKGKWINKNKAHFLYSKKLKSPMGAGLSAYETEEELSQFQKQYSGLILNSKELYEHVRNIQK